MKKRAIIYVCVLTMITGCVLASCDLIGSEARATVEMTKFPDNLVYVLENENALDLSGCMVRINTSFGSEEKKLEDTDCEIESDVNFNMPGLYSIRLKYDGKVFKTIPVEVVESTYIWERAAASRYKHYRIDLSLNVPMAIEIARAVWYPIYGESTDTCEVEAAYNGDIPLPTWTITSTIEVNGSPKNIRVTMQQRDAKILELE